MIWGVGYGAITQLIKETGNLVKNGVPNIDTYGDFLPLAYWRTESGFLIITYDVYFDAPITKGKYTQMVFSDVIIGADTTTDIRIGTTQKGYDLYKQVLATKTTYKEIKIDLSDFPDTFYLTIHHASSNVHYPKIANITLV